MLHSFLWRWRHLIVGVTAYPFNLNAAFDHLFPTFESSNNEPISVEPIDEEALAEARAEAGMVDDSTPDMGYYKSEHSQ